MVGRFRWEIKCVCVSCVCMCLGRSVKKIEDFRKFTMSSSSCGGSDFCPVIRKWMAPLSYRLHQQWILLFLDPVPPWPVASPQLKLKTWRCTDLGHLVPSRLLWRVLWPSPSAVGDCRCCGTCRGKTSHAPGASSWGCSSTQHPASSTPPRGPQKPYVRAQEFAQAPASFFHHWSMVGNGIKCPPSLASTAVLKCIHLWKNTDDIAEIFRMLRYVYIFQGCLSSMSIVYTGLSQHRYQKYYILGHVGAVIAGWVFTMYPYAHSRAVSAPCQLCTRGYRSTVTKSTIF